MSVTSDLASHKPEPGGVRPAPFTMLVEYAFEVRGRGVVAVAGIPEAGPVPPPGSEVTVSVRGKPTVRAVSIGAEPFDAHGPMTPLILRGVTLADVPKGARITATE